MTAPAATTSATSTDTSPTPTLDALITALRTADEAMATAARLLATGRIESEARLPRELIVRLHGRRARWDARDLSAVAELHASMPATSGLLARGVLSFSQARAIARAVRALPLAERARVDAHVARRAPALATCEPEELICQVEDLVAEATARRQARREQRTAEAEFLVLQPHLDGGGSLYGQAGATTFATIATALDDAAALPQASEAGPGEPTTRARQRMDALAAVCAAWGNQDQTGARPGRARILVTIQASAAGLSSQATEVAARILGATAGRPQRLSPIGTQVMLCDAELVPILTLDGRSVAVGDAIRDVPDKTRTAVVARDGGCRFPGCAAPASWSQIHHVGGRGGPMAHHPDNLVLLCKRCHDRVHHQRWRITMGQGGAIVFARGRDRFTSMPRAAPLHRRE